MKLKIFTGALATIEKEFNEEMADKHIEVESLKLDTHGKPEWGFFHLAILYEEVSE